MSETRRIEHPFPDDLEGRMNAVLNAVNTELKAVTLLHLDDRPVSGGEIKRRIRESVGRKQYLPQAVAIGNYCRDSHVPIGLVAREEVVRDAGDIEEVGYAITEAGRKYGQPIAAFSLDWAVQNGKSIYTILGATNSTRSYRPPLTRVKILKALEEREILRQTDIFGVTEVSWSGLTGHLDKLKTGGLITYDSIGPPYAGVGYSVYHWTGLKTVDELAPERDNNATRKIAEILARNGEANYQVIQKELRFDQTTISRSLSWLHKQGAAEPIKWKGGEVLSEVRILQAGEKFLKTYIAILESVLSNDIEATETLNRLLESEQWSNTLRKGIEMYRRVSPNINQRTHEETKNKIMEYVISHPGATVRKIATAIGKSRSLIRERTREMGEQKMLLIQLDENNRKMPGFYAAFSPP